MKRAPQKVRVEARWYSPLQQIRLEVLKKNQEEIAKKLKMSQGEYSKLETRRILPSHYALLLCDLFKLSPNDLFKRTTK